MNKAGIVAFAFGVPWNIRSNQRIAGIAENKAIDLSAPVYTQKDVHIDLISAVTYTEEELGHPPPSLRMARGAVRWACTRRITDLWVVAARPHISRCMRDLIKAVEQSGRQISIHVCQEEIDQFPEDLWFCLNSTQPRTRSRQAWERRERIFRYLPFWLYKIVAS